MKHFFFLIALVTPWLLAGYRAQAQAPAWQTAIALNSGSNRGEI